MRRDRSHSVLCRWCLQMGYQKEMFCLRNGPADSWFCDAACVETWLDNRHKPHIQRLLHMSSSQRVATLAGRSMEAYAHSE